MISSELKFFLKFLFTEDKTKIKLCEQINWVDFYKYSGNIRTLFFSLSHKNFLPEKVYYHLLQVSRETKANNKYLLSGAESINAIFNYEKVPIIFYKGIASLCTLYRNDISARMLADIDVIVPANFYEKAKALLEQHGFVEDYTEKGLGENKLAKQWFDENHFHSIYRKGNLEVELHRNLSYYFDSKCLETLFDSSITTINLSSEIQIPAPEFQILICILNFIHDKLMNKPSRWYLTFEAKSTSYVFISSCYEIKLICEYYQESINYAKLRNLIANSGEEGKVLFLLSQVAKIINQPSLNYLNRTFSLFNETRDPLKCLLASDVLFENTEIPKTNSKQAPIENWLRFLFLFSSIKPRHSPLGHAIFWAHCLWRLLISPLTYILRAIGF